MLNVQKYEMRSDADRNAFGNAALSMCRAVKNMSGINSANYYWVNANQIGFIIDYETGAWGPGSANQDANVIKANFAVADLSTLVSNEFWMTARGGTDNYEISK